MQRGFEHFETYLHQATTLRLCDHLLAKATLQIGYLVDRLGHATMVDNVDVSFVCIY